MGNRPSSMVYCPSSPIIPASSPTRPASYPSLSVPARTPFPVLQLRLVLQRDSPVADSDLPTSLRVLQCCSRVPAVARSFFFVLSFSRFVICELLHSNFEYRFFPLVAS